MTCNNCSVSNIKIYACFEHAMEVICSLCRTIRPIYLEAADKTDVIKIADSVYLITFLPPLPHPRWPAYMFS